MRCRECERSGEKRKKKGRKKGRRWNEGGDKETNIVRMKPRQHGSYSGTNSKGKESGRGECLREKEWEGSVPGSRWNL